VQLVSVQARDVIRDNWAVICENRTA
jgi:hypothetical protein